MAPAGCQVARSLATGWHGCTWVAHPGVYSAVAFVKEAHMQAEQLTASSSLDALIDALRRVVDGRDEAAVASSVAEQLGRFLTRDDLLAPEQCEPDPAHYRQHVLHVEPDGSFSVV